jgi:hypothetical protein
VVHLKRALQIVGLVSTLALLAPLAVTQESHITREGGAWGQEITGSLAAVKNLRVKVDMGSVVVRGGQQQGINYVVHTRFGTSSEQEARRQFEQYKITAYVKGDTAWIVGDWQGGRQPRHSSAEFSVMVPREMALVKLETEGGNVEASGVAGRVEAGSGGGSMKLDDIGGGASAETGGGSIDVGTVGGDLGLHTGGGSIKIRHANGKVVADTGGGSVELGSGAQGASIETGGGSVEVRECNGKVKVSTGGGSVDLSDVGGPAEIETGGGSIRLNSAKGHVHAETGGGGIELYGVPSARAETSAGGITVKLVNNGAERNNGVYCLRCRNRRARQRGHGQWTSHYVRLSRYSRYERRRQVGTEVAHCRRQAEWRRAYAESAYLDWRYLLSTRQPLREAMLIVDFRLLIEGAFFPRVFNQQSIEHAIGNCHAWQSRTKSQKFTVRKPSCANTLQPASC